MRRSVKEIEKYQLFQQLFPIDEKTKDRIKRDICENGFDENQPIVLAKWSGVDNEACVDGHTRLQVAEELGIDEIPTVSYSVTTEQDAFELALKRQVNRRSLSDAEIYQCIETISDRYGIPPNGGPSYSVQEVADKLGISKRKAERTLRVMEQATPQTKKEVKAGIRSINKAETVIKSSTKPAAELKDEPRKPRQGSTTVEIDPDQWDQLKRVAEMTDADIEEIVYEALEAYLAGDEAEQTENK